jgi:hypothetical protein
VSREMLDGGVGVGMVGAKASVCVGSVVLSGAVVLSGVVVHTTWSVLIG